MIPSRFKESAFKRYEPYIDVVMRNFPSVVRLNPEPLSPETFSCRFRDAVKAVLKYNYSTYLDLNKLRQIQPDMIVSMQETEIVIGDKDTIKQNKEPTPIGTLIHADAQPALEEVDSPGEKVLHAFCLLLSYQYLEQVTVKNVDNTTLNLIAQSYDVELIENDNGTTTLI